MAEFLEHLAILFGFKKMALVVGGVGAAVSMPFIEGTWRYKISLFIAGWAASVFVSPVVIAVMDVREAEYGIVFLVGVFAMSVTSAIIRSLQQITFEGLMEQIRLMFGRGGK